MSDKLKDKVLNNLLKVYDEMNSPGNTSAELAKGSFLDQIHKETQIPKDKLQLVLDSMYSEKYIEKLRIGHLFIWSITDKGRNAILTNYFKWYYYENFLKLMPILISLLSLIVSIVAICISLV